MKTITSRERVRRSIEHLQPDRIPVDFLAVTEIWQKLVDHFEITPPQLTESDYFNPTWETVLQYLEVDCRVISYDQFCTLPDKFLNKGDRISWWDSPNRSTPNRMWRRIRPDRKIMDIWGHIFSNNENKLGIREELAGFPLQEAKSVADLKNFRWPDPDWWDFSSIPSVLGKFDEDKENHIRYRLGSVFEMAWQLRGLETFLQDFILNPDIPHYIMERLTDILIEIGRRALDAGQGRFDMVYLYDDVATQQSLLFSKKMWAKFIRPYHEKIMSLAARHDLSVMYHCDGAVRPLIPEFIEIGIKVLNPVQSDAKDMDFERLKGDFGDRLAFHGGIDITHVLPYGSPDEVRLAVQDCIKKLGGNGGYILASTHHIQSNSPIENILAMYDVALRNGH